MSVSTEDVRHHLLDYPELNKLHDFKEVFSDEDINRGLEWGVDTFNSEPPLSIQYHSVSSFPHRKLLLMGATIYILRSQIINYQRNHLNYNDGGISISDKEQHQYIQSFLSQYIPEFKDLLTRTKQFTNIDCGYGSDF